MHFALLCWSHTDPGTPTFHDSRGPSRAGSHRPTFAGLFRLLLALMATAAGVLLPWPSQAAGGHHGIDDAALLEPGQCQLETWIEQGRQRQLQHLGPACHWLGLEWGLNLDRYAPRGNPVVRSAGLQLKWAQALRPGLSWGIVWAANWQSGSPRFAGQSLLLPLSWTPREDLALHLNAGRDFNRGEPDRPRYGLALEWQPSARWQGLVEQWHDGQQTRRRVGLRHLIDASLSVDLSRAQALGATHDAWWSLGLNWVFAR
ncbi:hypothetical protein LZ017_13030 [Pelomonas sp. CA6]|uniref:hypothetical protein n=1 Tax=Pelomonas sp. CA6 TaxID=2907999 RepID=UPI001F4C4CEF|nr:hypothetical protein [Pelomonas sp. CA6]MCH7344301.1 hypothetical protein [Pelomonas sp. CA6]